MRYVYIVLSGVLLALVLLFAIQNFRLVTVLFLDMSVTLPLAALIVVVYLLGMFTGGFIAALTRSWVRGVSR
ncbi:MAG: DUF1049 domain-containing protein [Gammaproteobacteria bacterium]|nr:DUF1049 domain-containing protein [Gammaproteobacteria bacterium]